MAEQTIPKPEPGQRFEDRFTEDFEWEVVESDDPQLVRLVASVPGEKDDGPRLLTGGVFDWPRDRWHVLFEGRQMLKVPGE
jgi:hypothetical protein